MARTIPFHLDENADPAIADGLRRRGIDVTTSQEVGLLGAADEAQLAHIRSQGRVLFTQDRDFLSLHAAGESHPGIAYCHPQSRSIGAILRGLVLIWEVLGPEDMQNHVEFL